MSLPRYANYKESGIGWLGSVPSHWDVCALKRVANLRSGESITSEQIEDSGQYPVYGGNGLRGFTSSYTHEDRFALIGRQGALCGNVNYSSGKFWASEHAIVATPVKPVDTTWLGETLRAMNLNQYSVSAAQPGLSVELISNLGVPYPPVEEQAIIAAFLDRETGKIDALIAEQEKLVTVLVEKRQATVSHAVTRGLNPEAPMKDSGVAWLGEVPERWKIRRLKQAVRPGVSVSYGIVQPGEPLDEGVPFVQTTNMSDASFEIEHLQRTTPEIAAAYPRSRLAGGEVILGIRASIGAAYVVPSHLVGANLSRGIARIECGEEIASDYLVHVLRSSATMNYWGLSKQGSTFNEVSIETVRELAFALPLREEQSRVSRFIDKELSKLNTLLVQARNAIRLLNERRSALITAAVTGQIDVRHA